MEDKNLVKINETELLVKEYENEIVVTSWDIARVHQREVREINQQFERNKGRLILGEDYFLLKKDKISESQIVIQDFIPNNVKEIPLFTESGYLMLIKTFSDDLSWNIQRKLVKNYFAFKRLQNSKKEYTTKELLLMQLESIERIEKLELENKQKQELLELQTPKVEFTDNVLQSEQVVTTTVIAKQYGMSAIAFNKLLHKLGVQYKVGKVWVLYDKYANMGYTKIITQLDSNGEAREISKWTQKGREFIYNLFKEIDILPVGV